MSMLVSLFKGYFEGDAEIMQSQREYDQEKLKIKEESLRQTEKENRAWVKELKKLGFKAINTKYNNINQGIIDGKLTPKQGVSLEKSQALEKAGVMAGLPFTSDITKLVNVMDKADEFGRTIGLFKFNSSFGTRDKNSWGDSQGALYDFDRIGKDPDFATKYNALSQAKKDEFNAHYRATVDKYTGEYDKNVRRANTDPSATPLFPNLTGRNPVTKELYFTGLNNINTLLGKQDSIDHVDAGDRLISNAVAAWSSKNKTDNKMDDLGTVFIKPSATNALESEPIYITGLDDKGKTALKDLSDNLGQKDPIKAGMSYVNFLGDIPGYTIDDKARLFQASLKYGSFPGIKGLDPDANQYRSMSEENEKLAYATFFTNKFIRPIDEGGFKDAVLAMSPYMMTSGQGQTGSLSEGSGSAPVRYTGQRYSEKMSGGMKYSEIKTRHDEAKFVVNGIAGPDGILAKVVEIGETEAFSSLRKLFLGTLSIKEGFLGDLIGTSQSYILKDGVDAIYTMEDGSQKVGVTSKFIKDFDTKIEQLRKDKGNIAAELEAMRITLAFRMARAADPSGRLSNQDVELQLQKLGGGFTRPSDAINKLKIVRDEFQAHVDATEIFVRYGNSPGFLTESQMKQFDAAIVLGHIRKKVTGKGLTQVKAGVQETTGFSTNPEDYKTPKSGRYMEGVVIRNGEFFYAKDNNFKNIIKIPQDQTKNYLK